MQTLDSKWNFINARRKDLLWVITIVMISNIFILTLVHLNTKAKISLSALSIINVLILIIGGVGIIDELKACSESLKSANDKTSKIVSSIPWSSFRILLPSIFILMSITQLYEIWL